MLFDRLCPEYVQSLRRLYVIESHLTRGFRVLISDSGSTDHDAYRGSDGIGYVHESYCPEIECTSALSSRTGQW